MTPLGERLRQLRKKHSYTVRELGSLLSKSPGYVSQIEVRGEIPKPELLCKIAELYEIDAEELLQLAKRSYLERTEREIDAKHASTLALYRKEKR